jgi:starch-binding outer membrane protein, SusD/RagB family
MNLKAHLKLVALVAGVAGLAACSDFLTVENPGPLKDEQLNTPSAMPGLVVGMSFELSRGLDEVLQNSSIMGDDLYHGGSYGDQGLFNRGIIRKEDVDQMWGEMHRARWVAEHGIERMKTVLGTGFDSSPLAVRAYVYAGLANRLLGEHVCDAVIDGGPKQPITVHFQRAEAHFTEALRVTGNLPVGTAGQRALKDSLTRVATGGRASVRAWLGNWTDAALDAAQVPTAYVFSAVFSTNTPEEDNDLVFETGHPRFEYTVYNTRWAQVFGDPRVPWDTSKTEGGDIQPGQDGQTPFFQQRKFNGLDSDVPMVKGTEMLMLRAEAALRAVPPDVPGAMALINQQRAFYDPGGSVLPPLSATTEAEAWPILQNERAAVLWIEGRRFWDLRRWNGEPPPIQNTFLNQRGKCIPVSENEEQSNPNF